jgi:hypothetical protein
MESTFKKGFHIQEHICMNTALNTFKPQVASFNILVARAGGCLRVFSWKLFKKHVLLQKFGKFCLNNTVVIL